MVRNLHLCLAHAGQWSLLCWGDREVTQAIGLNPGTCSSYGVRYHT
jgi:hypothetical protein